MQRFRRWAARAPKRFLAILVLAVIAYMGVTRVREILRAEACLDDGGRYDYVEHVCRR